MSPLLNVLGLSALLTASISVAANVQSEPRVIAATVDRVDTRTANAAQSLRRRAAPVNVPIQNSQGNLLYLVNATVGTPGQVLALQLDTGSSDIWLPSSSSRVCSRNNRCTDGSFTSANSRSFRTLSSGSFSISYVDTTQINGDYISDTFSIGGSTVQNMTMGLAQSSTTPDNTGIFNGIIGLGFASGESLAAQTGRTYPNFLQVLVTQGVIATQAYSLWLNDYRSTQSTLLLGGIDQAKYQGDLTILPIQPDANSNQITSFTVALDNVKVLGAGNSTQFSRNNLRAPVVLDSGTTLTYLPDEMANAIAAGVGAITSNAYGLVVPCNVGNTQSYITFQFGSSTGPTIIAPMSEFVLPFPDGVTPPRFRSNNAVGCQFGILPAGNAPLLLGDTFLRSAYVVYNIAGAQIGIAQTNFNATDSNIKEITAASSIPGAASTASVITAKQTATGLTALQTADQASTAVNGASTIMDSTATGTFNLGTPTATFVAPAATTRAGSGTGSGSGSGSGDGQKGAGVVNTGSTGSAFAAVIALMAAFV